MKRQALLLGLLLLTSGCGFSPLYGGGQSGEVAQGLGHVAIANIPDRPGQILRNQLIDRFYGQGRPRETDATLSVKLRQSEEDLGIQKDATATRRQLNIWADYILRAKDGAELLKGTAHSLVSYNKLEAQYGTVAAQRSAEERVLKEIGEQIVNRISLYYAQNPDAAP